MPTCAGPQQVRGDAVSPILLVVGAGLTVHNIASAPPPKRAQVATEEAGNWIGGWIFADAAIAIMIAAAPETGGLTLLGIGFVAGAAGGIGGGMAADKIYYSTHSGVGVQACHGGTIEPHMIQKFMPHPQTVCPRCHY